jgi:hypothetical protein
MEYSARYRYCFHNEDSGSMNVYIWWGRGEYRNESGGGKLGNDARMHENRRDFAMPSPPIYWCDGVPPELQE